jgi:hypothetical protein
MLDTCAFFRNNGALLDLTYLSRKENKMDAVKFSYYKTARVVSGGKYAFVSVSDYDAATDTFLVNGARVARSDLTDFVL